MYDLRRSGPGGEELPCLGGKRVQVSYDNVEVVLVNGSDPVEDTVREGLDVGSCEGQ